MPNSSLPASNKGIVACNGSTGNHIFFTADAMGDWKPAVIVEKADAEAATLSVVGELRVVA